jgi:catalase
MRLQASALALLSLLAIQASVSAQSTPDLARQIAEVMAQRPSGKAHQRYAHAKGIVCQGAFQASSDAAAISRAAHFSGGSVPVTVRFSDGAPNAEVADNAPDAAPRGMAIRFATGRGTDVMAISHNGFVVGNGEDFLALQKAVSATDSSSPHPWPIETFLNGHPRALKFVQDMKRIPVSFATESFYSNNALIFVNKEREKHAGRYQIIPVNGSQYVDDAAGRGLPPDYLREELRTRLENGPLSFRLLLQIAEPGDQTSDGSLVWPDDRRKVDLGTITIKSIVPDSVEAEKHLAFDPTRLVDGIELSDDPLPKLRSQVYAYSVAGRFGR